MKPYTCLRDPLFLPYIVTGSVATIVYGEPGLTHDLDLVFDLPLDRIDASAAAFPPADFYLPPKEMLAVECRRAQRGA